MIHLLRLTRVLFSSRCQKEATSHLSPVKKRVKENTPPHTQKDGHHHQQQQDWIGGGNNNSVPRSGETRQTIVIADSPSPVSVITISSDSEDENNQCSPKGYVAPD